jgi:hypothetical protein
MQKVYELNSRDRNRWFLLLRHMPKMIGYMSEITRSSSPLGSVCMAVVKRRVTFQHRPIESELSWWNRLCREMERSEALCLVTLWATCRASVQ